MKSRALFERAIQLRPDDVSTLVWLGNAYLDQGLPDDADAQFSKALSLDGRSISARYGLGRAALAKNDYRRAVTNLEEVLKMDPKAVSAHYPLSLAYNGLGDTKQAEAHLRLRKDHEILPADPLMVELEELVQSPQTFETLGIRALGREDWPGAAAQFRRGLELAPESAVAEISTRDHAEHDGRREGERNAVRGRRSHDRRSISPLSSAWASSGRRRGGTRTRSIGSRRRSLNVLTTRRRI